MDILSEEIVLHIFKYLRFDDVFSVSVLSKRYLFLSEIIFEKIFFKRNYSYREQCTFQMKHIYDKLKKYGVRGNNENLLLSETITINGCVPPEIKYLHTCKKLFVAGDNSFCYHSFPDILPPKLEALELCRTKFVTCPSNVKKLKLYESSLETTRNLVQLEKLTIMSSVSDFSENDKLKKTEDRTKSS